MDEQDIREYSRTLLDAFNDLTGNSINPNLDDFLKIRERSIFELNSFCKNNQKTNKISENIENVNDNEVVHFHSNQKTNVDENEIANGVVQNESSEAVQNEPNEIDDLKEHKELVSTSKTEDKPILIQNKKQNVDNKQQKNDNKINQESKNVVKNETSNSNVIADETNDFVFGNDENNFNTSERKTAFDILKGIEDPWN